jgi:hypothetical protein
VVIKELTPRNGGGKRVIRDWQCGRRAGGLLRRGGQELTAVRPFDAGEPEKNKISWKGSCPESVIETKTELEEVGGS